MDVRRFQTGLLALALGSLLFGCGGGSGGSSSGGGATLSLFAADDLTTSYSHVWVTLLKAEVVGPDGAKTVYDDSEGRTIDLTTLSGNGQAKFALLAQAEIPAGEYTSARFTFKNALSLVPTGSTTAVTRTFRGATGDTAVIPLALAGRLSGKCSIVADFDLSQWTDDGTTVGTVVRRHDGQGLDDGARHERNELRGAVASLSGTAPELTFTVSHGASTVKVITDSSTVITSHDESTSPTLANGARVEVSGAFDPTVSAIRATSIKIGEDSETEHDARVEGAPSAASTAGFTLMIGHCDGLLPTSTTVAVTFSSATVYRSDHGLTLTQAEFLAALATATRVEAEGAYDAATKTLAASSVRISGGDSGHQGGGGDGVRQIEVDGTVTASDATAGTLTFTARHWQGQSLRPGTAISVVTTDTTTYRAASGGSSLTKAAFFAGAVAGATIEVRGSLSGTTVTATRLRLGADDHGGEDGGHGGGNHG